MYATREDMINRFGRKEVVELTDVDWTGDINARVLDYALSTATDEINGYIAGRYTLPLPHVPAVLSGYACDIARYRMTGNQRQCDDEIRERYRDAIRYLEGVASGRVTLGVYRDTGTNVPSASGGVRFSGGRRLWRRSNTGGGGF
ncbi:DUF1320 domain-containing protein [Serratia marcescens]|uniref:DUF1320 domain-containing protein n=1 Tax=Serratia marcescens TaxID=615 RepID=A0A5C7BV08_SERMA|nr:MULTISPECIES: DUF1320 domain-containing protein [Serratia]TXE27147.1 DUF1320 domain-containing protein [Serratia marcescens]TXE55296.1 DUF1320 domain-containing protein [Serratia marcescens]